MYSPGTRDEIPSPLVAIHPKTKTNTIRCPAGEEEDILTSCSVVYVGVIPRCALSWCPKMILRVFRVVQEVQMFGRRP